MLNEPIHACTLLILKATCHTTPLTLAAPIPMPASPASSARVPTPFLLCCRSPSHPPPAGPFCSVFWNLHSFENLYPNLSIPSQNTPPTSWLPIKDMVLLVTLSRVFVIPRATGWTRNSDISASALQLPNHSTSTLTQNSSQVTYRTVTNVEMSPRNLRPAPNLLAVSLTLDFVAKFQSLSDKSSPFH